MAWYIISFINGILTFISPCILPMLPVYFFYLAGISGKEETETNTGKPCKRYLLIANSIAFVIGFTFVFVALGATATSIGHFLKANIDIFRKISGILMVVFGLHFMGIFNLKVLNAERRINYEYKEPKFISSVIFGVVFGFAWTPCLTAFLGTVLLLAGNSDTVVQGVLLLLVYSMGLGVPFLLTALVFQKARGALKRINSYRRIISIVSGIVLILAGILVFTDYLKYAGTFV